MTFYDNGCPQCAAGANPAHITNTDKTQTEIIQVDGDYIHPRRVLPEDVCVHELKNFLPTIDKTDPAYVAPADQKPFVWNTAECRVEPGEFPCFTKVEWDRTVDPEPTDAECVAGCDNGETRVYVETSSNTVTHICVDGVITPYSGSEDDLQVLDQVCYDISGWQYPVTWGGGQGQWEVFGADRLPTACDTQPVNYAVGSNIEYACWGDFGFSEPPLAGWNSLTWADDTISGGLPLEISVDGDAPVNHGCPFPAFRVLPTIPVGASGPVVLTFEITTPAATNSTISWTAYDTVSGDPFTPLTTTQPAGGTASNNVTGGGTVVTSFATEAGLYSTTFDLGSVAGALAQNVAFVLYNVGNPADVATSTVEPESLNIQQILAVPSGTACCNTWNSANQVLLQLNAVDPSSGAWELDANGRACATFAAGVGAQYGLLEGCTENATPIVTSVTGSGTTSDSFVTWVEDPPNNCATLTSASGAETLQVSTNCTPTADTFVTWVEDIPTQCATVTSADGLDTLLVSTDCCPHLSLCGRAQFNSIDITAAYNAGTVNLLTVTADVTNPSNCRPARVWLDHSWKAQLNSNPTTAGGDVRFSVEEVYSIDGFVQASAGGPDRALVVDSSPGLSVMTLGAYGGSGCMTLDPGETKPHTLSIVVSPLGLTNPIDFGVLQNIRLSYFLSTTT